MLSPLAFKLSQRVAAELSADFAPGRPTYYATAPAVLDVMGEATIEYPLDEGVAVALQVRGDREIQIFSFEQFDRHEPFTIRLSVENLFNSSWDQLWRDLSEPGRNWAWGIVDTFKALSDFCVVKSRTFTSGFNLAFLEERHDTGLSSSPDAAGLLLVAHAMDVLRLIDAQTLCYLAGAFGGLFGELGKMLEVAQDGQTRAWSVPGVRVLAVYTAISGGKPSADRIHRTAARLALEMILEKMRQMGEAAHAEMVDDPIKGSLANLPPDDYKRFFRPYLPEFAKGGELIERWGSLVPRIQSDLVYPIQHAADHQVLDAQRVRNFINFLREAEKHEIGSLPYRREVNKAGHLMYASHLSYTNDAFLGHPDYDRLVQLLRAGSRRGVYGARLGGREVAVLCNDSPETLSAIEEIVAGFAKETGHPAKVLSGSMPGAWHSGVQTVQGSVSP